MRTRKRAERTECDFFCSIVSVLPLVNQLQICVRRRHSRRCKTCQIRVTQLTEKNLNGGKCIALHHVPTPGIFIQTKYSAITWRIFVYIFASITLLSVSDRAYKIISLNTERVQQFQSSFWRNSLLKTRNFTKNVWLFRICWWLILPLMLLSKSCKLHKFLKLISSFKFSIYFLYTATTSMN